MAQENIAVIVHGGAAGEVLPEEKPGCVAGLKLALDAAWSKLTSDAGGLEAVVAALRELEACEYFDAGYGSYPNENGEIFQDIGLISGELDYLAIANIPRIKHPSALAHDMFRKGDRLMVAWTKRREEELESRIAEAGEALRERYGWVMDGKELLAPHALKVAQRERERRAQKSSGDTVGCVVRDGNGHLFAGTSTGGILLKREGRIGDSPIIGGGVYADNEVIGISATGNGEDFLGSLTLGHVVSRARTALRVDPSAFEREPQLLSQLLSEELKEMARRSKCGQGGLIALSVRGLPAYSFTSKSLHLGYRYGDNKKVHGELIEVRSNS